MNSRRLMGIPSARTPREPRLSHSRRRLLCITANFDGLCRLAAFAAIAGLFPPVATITGTGR